MSARKLEMELTSSGLAVAERIDDCMRDLHKEGVKRVKEKEGLGPAR